MSQGVDCLANNVFIKQGYATSAIKGRINPVTMVLVFFIGKKENAVQGVLRVFAEARVLLTFLFQ